MNETDELSKSSGNFLSQIKTIKLYYDEFEI